MSDYIKRINEALKEELGSTYQMQEDELHIYLTLKSIKLNEFPEKYAFTSEMTEEEFDNKFNKIFNLENNNEEN